jgi:hypothetical protein
MQESELVVFSVDEDAPTHEWAGKAHRSVICGDLSTRKR